ncbi:hypothetical protein BT69DRAFT_1315626 [Atractiella rhizophila]|nr:hypothetical protein BT69DRAFT_1315626 [Atractiella rhizophila]
MSCFQPNSLLSWTRTQRTMANTNAQTTKRFFSNLRIPPPPRPIFSKPQAFRIRQLRQQSTIASSATSSATGEANILRPVLWSLGLSAGTLVASAWITNREIREEIRRKDNYKTKGKMEGKSSLPIPQITSLILLTQISLFAASRLPTKRFPKVQPWLETHFTHTPLSGRSYTLLTSNFFTKRWTPFIGKLIFIASLGREVERRFGEDLAEREIGRRKDAGEEVRGFELPPTIGKYHFLAFYLTAGTLSVLASHVFHAVRINRLLIGGKGLSTSLKGALNPAMTITSGILYSWVAFEIVSPLREGYVIFGPSNEFHVKWLGSGLLTFDFLGLYKGWLGYNHLANITGAVFGVFYFYIGKNWWNWVRERLEGDRVFIDRRMAILDTDSPADEQVLPTPTSTEKLIQ